MTRPEFLYCGVFMTCASLPQHKICIYALGTVQLVLHYCTLEVNYLDMQHKIGQSHIRILCTCVLGIAFTSSQLAQTEIPIRHKKAYTSTHFMGLTTTYSLVIQYSTVP